ncbi:MAG: hypothetical protein Q4A58_04190 [Fusobacterium sp.]|uniref:hypothetical protein n=1 Tax=Fusobacterium sp. TaxID=68766 RepID=UPI0026DD0594|nr:hypothetical protein [Fusobacterium sp.]MDO4690476.1 hypothetical protein [Fusobacterium sp.]
MNLDKVLMNFSEEHELNSFLNKIGKRQTAENREKLKELGKKCKLELGKRVLKHDDFEEFLKKNKDLTKKLEDKK